MHVHKHILMSLHTSISKDWNPHMFSVLQVSKAFFIYRRNRLKHQILKTVLRVKNINLRFTHYTALFASTFFI